jgi:hypothetical protein
MQRLDHAGRRNKDKRGFLICFEDADFKSVHGNLSSRRRKDTGGKLELVIVHAYF